MAFMFFYGILCDTLKKSRGKNLIIVPPPRSPDLNPIENMFKSVSDDLHDSAIEEQLERESFTQFKERVKNTIVQFPVAKINNLIESTNRRLQLILETQYFRD